MAAPIPPSRPGFTLAWVAALCVLTGVMWSTLLARVGPNFTDVGARCPAKDTTELLNHLASRFLIQRAVEGRVTLMPFQPMLWEGDRAFGIQARVMVPGLTHVDVVAQISSEERVIFRLSRHGAVPSALIHQRGGEAVEVVEITGDWAVDESIITPERRSHLLQANYHHPNDTFFDVEDEYEGEWYEVSLARDGETFTATVNGDAVGSITVNSDAPTAWGLEGGDLPFVYVSDVTLLPGREISFASRWSAPGMRLMALGAVALLTAGLLTLLATLSWGLAPGLPWWVWMQRMIPCGLVLAALPGEVVLTHGIEFAYTRVQVLRFSLYGVGVVWWLLLAGQGRQWRWRGKALDESGLWDSLRINWRRYQIWAWIFPVFLFVALYGLVPLGCLLLDKAPYSPDLRLNLTPTGRKVLQRGDVLRTERTDFSEGVLLLDFTPQTDVTTVELLTRLRNHSGGWLEDWNTVRLSTQPGESGFLQSDDPFTFQPVNLALQPGSLHSVSLHSVGSRHRLRVGGSDIATFRSDDFATGGFAVLLRDGQAAVQSANALVTVAEPGRGGSSWLRARDYWLSVPLLLLLALGAGGLVAYVLASWFANDASPMLRYTLTLSLYAWMAVTVLRLWINRRPPELFGYHPDFALWCGAIVAAAGVYLWLAGQWPHLKRRLPALILLTLAIPPCVEKAVRLSPLKWTWEADFQGGYIRDQYLVRPILGPLMWMTASGDYQARNRPARPRNHPDTANPEAIRVVTLGASSTYGSGVMEAKDAWPSVMEGMLQESAGDGVSVEVFNFGYPSLTSFDDVMFLERDLLSLEPDVVTISVTGNEAICPHGNPPPQQDEWDSHNALSPLQKRLRHNILSLRTLVGFNHWLNDALTPVEDTHTEEQHPPEDFRATLNQLCDLAEEHGFRVVLIAEPIWERMLFADSYHQPWVDVMNEVSEARGVALVDPVPDFAAHLADAMWATWIHPTVMGNRVMAGAVTPTVASAIGEARRGADQAP